MPFDVGDLVGLAAKEVAESFGTATGVVAGYYRDAFEALPDGPPVVSLARGIAQQACRRWADNPTGVPGPIAAGFESVCRPYLDSIGYGQPPGLDKPFEGGQCPGALYRVDYEYTNGDDNFLPAVLFLRGPLSIDTTPDPGDGGASCPPGTSFTRKTLVGFNGERRTLNSGCNTKSRILGVSPFEGAPNNCGNPPPVYTPPRAPALPGPVREPFSPAPGIDIDIDLTIGPTGDITFNIGTGPITINPFPGGDDDGGGGDNPGIDQPGTAPSSGLPPGDIGSPAPPSDTGEGGDASGCAPPNSVLVGIKIDILATPAFSSEYDPLVRRGVCYAYMGTVDNLALEPSGVALRSGQMLFAPLDNLTCWEVRANTGYQLRVTPYYRALELTEV